MIHPTRYLRRAHRFPRWAYRFVLKRALRKGPNSPASKERREQFGHLLRKLQSTGTLLVCTLGTKDHRIPGEEMALLRADFDIASSNNIVDLVQRHSVGAFYVNRCAPRDLVNLVNFLDAYNLDVPILLGDQFRIRSLIGYVPVMPGEAVSFTVYVHNYFAKNYKISDTLLCQGSLYQGNELLDTHQFFIRPEETRVVNIHKELDTQGMTAGTYYLEIFHPQLPTTTPECRFFGIYQDNESGFMAGSHALPRGSWHDSGAQSATMTRTFIPNIDGTVMRYIMPGTAAHDGGTQIQAGTTLGQKLEITLSQGKGSFQTVIRSTEAKEAAPALEFDRVAPGIPTIGGQGFQTLWLEGKGLAIWHDGSWVRQVRKGMDQHIIDANKPVPGYTTKIKPRDGILQDERQESRQIASNSLELYMSRAKFFLTVFPYLGPSYPDLNVVFDREQWVNDLSQFDIALHSNDGTQISTKAFTFNGLLQTLNLNKLFASELVEFAQGYWVITADPSSQLGVEALRNLQFPSDDMLFGFWGDESHIYDSVHSLTSINRVAFDLHQAGSSDIATATNRIVARTKKFAPFMASEGRSSWFWICNVGRSEEKIDATLKVRVLGLAGEEGVTSYFLPANSAQILSSDQILDDCKVSIPRGIIWLESNNCNMGAMWFLQAGEGNGFAVDHFTGG